MADSIQARFLNNRFFASGWQLEQCFATVNFAKVDVKETIRIALILFRERIILGKLDLCVIDETLLKLADNLDEFDESMLKRSTALMDLHLIL